MMNLLQLRQFLVLAETLSFRGAAEKLHISQPPLTVSIRKLEEEFGTRLFARSTRSVKLTPAGVAVLREIRQAMLHIDRAKRHALEAEGGVRGTLRIGSVGSATISLLPRVVPSFQEKYQAAELDIHEFPSNKVLEGVERGTLDLGFVRTPVVGSYDVDSVPMEQDRFVAAVPDRHPLANRRAIHLRELASEAFISYSRNDSSGIHFAVANSCHAAGFSPLIVHEATQIQAAVSLVAVGMGVALVPSLHARSRHDGVSFLELTGPSATFEIGLALVFRSMNETVLGRAFREFSIKLVGKPNAGVRRRVIAPGKGKL